MALTGKFRFFFLFINFFIALIGVTMVGYGVFEMIQAEDSKPQIEAIVMMTLGFLVIFVEGLAIFGVMEENRFYLYAFAGVLIILGVGLILWGIVFLGFKMAKKFGRSHVESLFERLERGENEARLQVDFVQKLLGCCGWEGPEYWKKLGLERVPNSCCKGAVSLNLDFLQCLDFVGGGGEPLEVFEMGCKTHFSGFDVNVGQAVCSIIFGFILIASFIVTLFIVAEIRRTRRSTRITMYDIKRAWRSARATMSFRRPPLIEGQ